MIPVVDKLKVGEFSDIKEYKTIDKTGEGKTGVRIIWLKSETKPHKASLDQDYAKIQSAAKAEKQQRALENWVRLHRPNSYVHIDDSMKGCPQMSKWID
jgi:peptidyl-prolyl cis-trans isomerase SurA